MAKNPLIMKTSDGGTFAGFDPVPDTMLAFADLRKLSDVASATQVPDHLDLAGTQGGPRQHQIVDRHAGE